MKKDRTLSEYMELMERQRLGLEPDEEYTNDPFDKRFRQNK